MAATPALSATGSLITTLLCSHGKQKAAGLSRPCLLQGEPPKQEVCTRGSGSKSAAVVVWWRDRRTPSVFTHLFHTSQAYAMILIKWLYFPTVGKLCIGSVVTAPQDPLASSACGWAHKGANIASSEFDPPKVRLLLKQGPYGDTRSLMGQQPMSMGSTVRKRPPVV